MLIAGIAILAAVALAVTSMTVRRRAWAARSVLNSRLGDAEPLMLGPCRFFGQSNVGPDGPRGEGWLALTEQEIVFVQWVPQQELRIPQQAILAVGTTDEFLERSADRPLLHLHWNDHGQPSEAAWRVPELDAWLAALERVRED